MKIILPEQMRNIDRQALVQYGISELVLMENAGLSAYYLLHQKLNIPSTRFGFVCGTGNNGGDGFVLARILHANGANVEVLLLGDPVKIGGSAQVNFEILRKLAIPFVPVKTVEELKINLSDRDIIIDAIFGTGLSKEPSELFAEAIQIINSSEKPVLSLDIPSGVHAGTGEVLKTAVRASWTITFGLPKIGNLRYPGHQYNGELYCSHISLPPSLLDDPKIEQEVNQPVTIPLRSPYGNKSTFGEALFIAGSANYYGAPYFAAESFYKAGGGYARLAAPRSLVPFIAMKGSEIVFIPQNENSRGSLTGEPTASLLDLALKMDMVVLGPGLSLDNDAQSFALDVIKKIDRPLLIDGDGLTALSRDLPVLQNRKSKTILTPHPGEMSRLIGKSIMDVLINGVDIVRQFCQQWNVYLVLKCAHSLIGFPDGKIFINMGGNSGMATAGSGDVLTGTIAAMNGLGLPVGEAVRMGVFVHGLAGDLAAMEIGEDGMTAQSILDYLPKAMKLIRDGLDTKTTVFKKYHIPLM